MGELELDGAPVWETKVDAGTLSDFWLPSGAVEGMEDFTASSSMTASNGLIDLEPQQVTIDREISTEVALAWTEESVEIETSTELPSSTLLTE